MKRVKKLAISTRPEAPVSIQTRPQSGASRVSRQARLCALIRGPSKIRARPPGVRPGPTSKHPGQALRPDTSCSCRARRIGVSSRISPPPRSCLAERISPCRERKIRSPVRRRASETPTQQRCPSAASCPPPPLRIWCGDPDRTAFTTPVLVAYSALRRKAGVSALLRGSAGTVLDSGRGLADDGGGEAGAGVPAGARGGG